MSVLIRQDLFRVGTLMWPNSRWRQRALALSFCREGFRGSMSLVARVSASTLGAMSRLFPFLVLVLLTGCASQIPDPARQTYWDIQKATHDIRKPDSARFSRRHSHAVFSKRGMGMEEVGLIREI